ncbi:MAG: CoA ester lyase [Candidatus Velthaea sp.]
MEIALLFVPGDRSDRFAKAAASGADAVIVDLEDAVAPARKASARADVRAALDAGLRAYVRVNAATSPVGEADLAALAGAAPLGVMLPKAAGAADVAAANRALPGIALIPLIESIAGMQNIDAIAAGHDVRALAFGAYDFSAELGARPLRKVLAPWRARIVFAARAAGIAAIDAPYNALDDEEALVREARAAADFGFDGKLAIHPRQVPVIQRAFRPSADEVTRARAIVTQSDGGASAVNGEMIDAPIVEAARRVLERAGR